MQSTMVSDETIYRATPLDRPAQDTSPAMCPSAGVALNTVARYKQHNEILTSTALEFMHAWVDGLVTDLDPEAVRRLQICMDPNVKICFSGGLDCITHHAQGYPAVEEHLQKEKTRYGAPMHHSVCTVGTDEDADVAFVLMECKPADTSEFNRCWGGLPCYQVMMLDIAVDDTDGRVTCVTGLRHLSTAELTKLAGTENLGKGLDFHLPMHLMKAQPEGVDPTTLATFAKDYSLARSSAHGNIYTISQHLSSTWEGYDPMGRLSLLTSRGEITDHPDSRAGVIDEKALMELLSNQMATYDVKTRVKDLAASGDANIGFVHWMSELTLKIPTDPPAPPKEGILATEIPVSDQDTIGRHCFTMEGVNVLFFDTEGKSNASWVFRYPIESEKILMRGA